MEMVLRGLAIYVVLMILFRVGGKRALSEVTTFDFVLLLIVAEATQQALLGEDYSLVNALVVIVTLIGVDVALSIWKQRRPLVAQLVEGVPLVIVEDGRLLRERMDKERVDETDILAAARQTQGVERMDQIKYAVLERNGGITVIAKR